MKRRLSGIGNRSSSLNNESTTTLSEDTHPNFDPFNLPMLSAGIGTVTVYLTSGSVRLFNPMSEKAYKTCFFFDYAGHQLMHVLSAIGTEFAYRMIELHRKQAQESAVKMVATVSRVLLFNTLMLTIFMLVLNAGIVLCFGLASGSDSMDSMVEPAE
ncbi:hypothetical protein pdam_00005949 [Pocillopora damicornis]|uniref:Uncharacterized protein n=1 Tax=Pocillopora damicornis TaxID=46731 RepID=A0A3M6TDI5_POCDA|nr:hypothetical protein pdam_00005949 [Pocillopora damicornis]